MTPPAARERLEDAVLAILTAKAAAAPYSSEAVTLLSVALRCAQDARRVLEFDLGTAARTIIREKVA